MKSVYQHLTERSAPIAKTELLEPLKEKSKLSFIKSADKFLYYFRDYTQDLEQFYKEDGIKFDTFEQALWGHETIDNSFTASVEEMWALLDTNTTKLIQDTFNNQEVVTIDTFKELLRDNDALYSAVYDSMEDTMSKGEVYYTQKLFKEFCAESRFFNYSYGPEIVLTLTEEDVSTYLSSNWKDVGCLIKLQPIWQDLKMEMMRFEDNFNEGVQDKINQ